MQSSERAVLLHAKFSKVGLSGHACDDDRAEFHELTVSAGVNPVAEVTSSREKPDPKYLVGAHKAQELRECIETVKAGIVLVNFDLSPSQERNLERFLNCRVLDRTGLILDIFAQRATSHEGRLQVELAQLQHLSTRLVRGWTHLERQKGGIGLRGPGETQLETDRRLLGMRVKQLKKRLAKVRNSRYQGRHARQKAQIQTVSIVGYTNAGKSTLFNKITHSQVHTADKLFATLDPTLRRLQLPDCDTVILADTVGFIRQLPHDLVEAFHSTLEETREAELLLHVVDVSREDYKQNIEHVNSVLKQIDAQGVRQLMVFNKIDLLNDMQPRIDYDESGKPSKVWLSAKSGGGTELLTQALSKLMRRGIEHVKFLVPASCGKARAEIFERAQVLDEQVTTDGDTVLEVKLNKDDVAYILKQYAVSIFDDFDTGEKQVVNYCD
jgi:GTP-binding protein HflX